MRPTRLRYLAEVNPSTPDFDRLSPEQQVTFMPLETVWADHRLDTGRVRPKSEVATGYVRFRDGDILLPKVTPTFQAGRSATVNGLNGGVGAGSTELHVLRTRRNVDSRFVRYCLQTSRFLGEGVAAFKGVAGLQRVPENFVRDFEVPLVPLVDQRRIADFLDAQVVLIDRGSALREQQFGLMEERRAGSWAETMATIGIDIAGLDPFDRSDRWWRLSKVLRQLTNGFVGPTRDLLVEEGVPYLQSLHIKNGSIDFARHPYYVPAGWVASRPRIRLQVDDLLIVQTGALGEVALVGTEFAGSSCHALLIARVDRGLMRADFLAHLLRSDWGKNALLRRKTGALHPHLDAGEIRDILIPVPNLADQAAVVRALAERESESNRLNSLIRRQQALLSERKQSLITGAVTGQFDVTTARSVA